jgi:putative flippase GtrA
MLIVRRRAALRALGKRVSGPRMNRFHDITGRIAAAWHERTVALKAVSFAIVGVVNAAVDFAVFFVALGLLSASAAAVAIASAISGLCQCMSTDTWLIIPANVIAWLVAVSGSYAMNSFTTFAHESGRKLRWRDYGKFVASGIAGVIANTTTVVIAALFVPVWAAKLIAILVGFVVNFSLSHFVVFRRRI